MTLWSPIVPSVSEMTVTISCSRHSPTRPVGRCSTGSSSGTGARSPRWSRSWTMTRFGVMKHLRSWRRPGWWSATKRSGREKLHFLNPVPIRLIHDRWIDKYTERQVGASPTSKRNWRRHHDRLPMTATDHPGLPRLHQGLARGHLAGHHLPRSGTGATATTPRGADHLVSRAARVQALANGRDEGGGDATTWSSRARPSTSRRLTGERGAGRRRLAVHPLRPAKSLLETGSAMGGRIHHRSWRSGLARSAMTADLSGANTRPVEDGIVRDFKVNLSYGRYLHLDEILAAQHRSACPNTTTSCCSSSSTRPRSCGSSWCCTSCGRCEAPGRRRAAPGAQGPGPGQAHPATLTEQWSVLATLTPSEYAEFRSFLGTSSGFQSYSTGRSSSSSATRTGGCCRSSTTSRRARALLAEPLEAPSVYDEFLRYLARHGHDVPKEILERDVTQPYEFHPDLVPVFAAVYQNRSRLGGVRSLRGTRRPGGELPALALPAPQDGGTHDRREARHRRLQRGLVPARRPGPDILPRAVRGPDRDRGLTTEITRSVIQRNGYVRSVEDWARRPEVAPLSNRGDTPCRSTVHRPSCAAWALSPRWGSPSPPRCSRRPAPRPPRRRRA